MVVDGVQHAHGGAGRKGSEPPAAAGATVPSMGPIAGGPPQATYPLAESDAVIPQRALL